MRILYLVKRISFFISCKFILLDNLAVDVKEYNFYERITYTNDAAVPADKVKASAEYDSFFPAGRFL